jgi:isopentenyl-diphosphate delta-isomerase
MKVIYVDDKDSEIGSGSISDAVENGIAVRIVRTLLISSQDELLIQKRSASVFIDPNKWDHSSAGHVDEGETYKEAAHRELEEEMGIRNVDLIRITNYYNEHPEKTGLVKKAFVTMYIGEYDGAVSIDHDEVSDYRWISLDDLKEEISSHPDKFTNSLKSALDVYQKMGIDLTAKSSQAKA